MAAEHGLGIVDGPGFASRSPIRRLRAAALADEHPAVAATDAAVVEALVTPRLPEATWRFWHDASAVAALVDKGAASAAILCSPVSVATDARRRGRPACACRRRRRSSHRSHAPGWCSASSTEWSDWFSSTVQVGAERSSFERSPGPLRSAAATS